MRISGSGGFPGDALRNVFITEVFLDVEEICALSFLILSFHLAFWPSKVPGRKFEPKN